MNVNEFGFLWYLQSSSNMVNIFLKNLIDTAEDKDLRGVLDEINSLSTFQEKEATKLLNDSGYNETPFFSEVDLYNSSVKLFTDQLIIEILKHITGNGMRILASQYAELGDMNVKKFFSELLTKMIQIDESLLGLLKEKNLLQNSPFLYTKAHERESKLFKVISTQLRPLNAVELGHMYSALQCNNVGVALCAAFADLVKDEESKQLINDGKKLAFHQAAALSDILRENGVSTTTGLESFVHSVDESPFSDKLMTNLLMFLNPIGIITLQNAAVSSYKKNHVKILHELIEQVQSFSEKGFKLLVNKGWFIEPPVTSRSIK
ncbi:DUF3231 family protein [Bacillus sp. UNC438CL73TsuS30]|uniref:DUF3231 family protein n=1 Tax=Bacillus sp. UNC438CL73TsuS30 TaxID=1340434 RepID=UPI00047C9EBD|nr:DUF3231 family protein [Bacillus sp. UNC438CL73TsuS30]